MVRVSVLMPMRNTVRHVRDAVASVLAQDFRDFELIVVDDGSTDGSGAVVSTFRDPRVRLLRGPGRGVSAAWNVALAAATGDAVMQCDSDDLYPGGRIAPQVEYLDTHPEFGAVCGGFSTMEASGRHAADLWNPMAEEEDITRELLAGRTRTSLCTFAVRRAHLAGLGGKREFFETAEDIDLQLRLAEVCRVWYQPRLTYRYRLHDPSLTHSQASARRRFYEEYARELRAQRACGCADDLQRGAPRQPPGDASSPDLSREQLHGMLLGEAWRTHARGDRMAALRLGLRALARAPAEMRTWKSLAALIVKRPRGRA